MKNINELIFRVNDNLRNNMNVKKDDIKELLAIAMKMEKQFAISGVVGRSEQFYCQCDVPETDPLNPYSDDCYKCGDKLQ